MKETGDDARAIREANAAVDKMGKDKRLLPDGIVFREMPISLSSPKSFNAESREAEAVLSTGSAVRRNDYNGDFDEVLDMGPKSVRLARLNNGAQLLDSHDWHGGLDAVLGAVMPGTARIENGNLVARIKFSRSERGQRVANDLADGIPLLLSAGYKVHQVREDLTTSPPTRRVMDWEPLEVSVVTISAEEVGAGFRSHPQSWRTGVMKMKKLLKRADETQDQYVVRVGLFLATEHAIKDEKPEALHARALDYIKRAEAGEFDEKTKTAEEEAAEAAAAEAAAAAAATAAAAAAAAEARGTAIRRQPEPLTGIEAMRVAADMIKISREAKMPEDAVETALREGITVEQFRVRAFDFMVKKQAETRTQGSHGDGADGGQGTSMSVMGDPLTGRNAAMAEAIMVRILASNRNPAVKTDEQREWAKSRGVTDIVARSFAINDGHEKFENAQARQYMGMSLVEIAAECIGYRGRGLITAARGAEIMARAFNSTSDFPNIFLNAMNKALMARYQIALPTYREIAVQRNFRDFRPHYMIRAGDFPVLQPISEAGELRHGTSVDSKESVSVKPYGIVFDITRQMLVNDDMGAIDTILGGTSDGVLTFENETFYTMFNSNPTLVTDSLAVFAYGAITFPPDTAVGHNNYADTHAHGADSPSVDTISAGRMALRQMKNMSGKYINVPASIVLSGPEQETNVDKMITTITPTLVSSVNPFSGKLRGVSDAHIEGLDWYMLCDPAKVPCFVYGFLEGNTGPRVRTDEPFGVQGLRVSLEHDFGVGAIDYRGVYRNSGLTA